MTATEKNRLQLAALLKEFVEHDGIRSYDSTLCWDCGNPEPEKVERIIAQGNYSETQIGEARREAVHSPDCLIIRARKAIEISEKLSAAKEQSASLGAAELFSLLTNAIQEADYFQKHVVKISDRDYSKVYIDARVDLEWLAKAIREKVETS